MSDAVTSREGAWHQSTVGTLLDVCARQYALTYVAQIPTPQPDWAKVGTAYHYGVEQHQQARINGACLDEAGTLAAALRNYYDNDGDPALEAEVVAAVHHFFHTKDTELGVTIVEHLATLTPVALETYFRLPLVDGTMPVAGTFDGLYRDSDGRHILIDHKTAGSFNNWSRSGEGHRTQASFYAAALTVSPDFPDITELPEVRYLVVRKTAGKSKAFDGARIVSVQPDLTDIQVLGNRIREAHSLVEAGEFLPNPASNLCSRTWCPFWDRCQGTGELAGSWPAVLTGSQLSALPEGAGTMTSGQQGAVHS
jgi:hypothetical protein